MKRPYNGPRRAGNGGLAMFRKLIKNLCCLHPRAEHRHGRKSLTLLVIRMTVSEGPRPRIFGNFLPFFDRLIEFLTESQHIEIGQLDKTLIQRENLKLWSVPGPIFNSKSQI